MSILVTHWGEQAGERIHRISGNLNLRAYGFTAGLTSQVQWHFEQSISTDFNAHL